MSKIDLSDDLIVRFEMFPNFRRPVNNEDRRIGSIKFSTDGERLVAANNQRILELYNCNTGQLVRPFYLFKHGMSVIDYMDANDRILIGSIGATKGDFAIRELDMANNKFATSYVGHQKPSVSLSVNMEKKLFVSGGHDKTVLLFDFRVPSPQIGLPNLAAVPIVAIHPKTDDLCAVALEDNRIELYDLRFLKSPFTVFKFNSDPMRWTHFKFSPNGDQILISSNTPRIRIINSFNGTPQAILGSRQNTLNIPIDASFTPESEYILSGSSDGKVYVFNNKTSNYRQDANEPRHAILQSMQPEAITMVEINPKYAMMATASSYVAFWAPPPA